MRTHEEPNLKLHGGRAQREHFGARGYCIAGEVNEDVHIGSPDLSCNLNKKRMRGASVCGKMVDEIGMNWRRTSSNRSCEMSTMPLLHPATMLLRSGLLSPARPL
jgi:hypothetical protein